MGSLPTIISDLAMLLLVAGVTTLLFKRLNQPLVLGYIIAGFLTGPNFSFFPTLTDISNIHTWADIGVIFLMFALGLEFSFYKLKKVGSTAFLGTAVILLGMLTLGYNCGQLLGWSRMDSIFLGGMVSMSSTAIVIKAFDDLRLKGQPFTEPVFGILIVEDIAGIVMLVLLSTIDLAEDAISPWQMISSIARLNFYLILWFVTGMYVIPSFYRKCAKLMNDETLLVVSLGLCLGMVGLANEMGFSSALGAFLMGSLIAEAPSAEDIERLVKPVKDLFGAVFFVSVGMLVNPQLLAQYALPVAVLVLVTILGQLTFATLGVILAGKDLKTALRCGLSLTQIGEFSFIIASLGNSLEIISDFLYPIIVAVSVITTFTTPFCINAAEPAYKLFTKMLPAKWLNNIERYTNKGSSPEDDENTWHLVLQAYTMRLAVFATLLIAIAMSAVTYLVPYLSSLSLPYSNYIAAAITLLFMAPILSAILLNRSSVADLCVTLWLKSRRNHLPIMVMVLFKIMVAVAAIYFVSSKIAELSSLWSLAVVIVIFYIVSTSEWLLSEYLRMEARFLVNLNAKHMQRHRATVAPENSSKDNSLFDESLLLGRFQVLENSALIGQSLRNTSLRTIYGFNILQIATPEETLDMPGGRAVIPKGAVLLIIGSKNHFDILEEAITNGLLKLRVHTEPQTLRDFMLKGQSTEQEKQFLPCALTIDEHSPLLGKNLRQVNIREKWHCLVIGLERGAYIISNPNVALVFEKGDLLWVLGKQKMINTLVKEEIL